MHSRKMQGNCAMNLDFFSEIKQHVPTVDAAKYYGFSPNRAGFIACPIHGERTPSLKLYGGTSGWYCFGCQCGGSVIDFVSQVFSLDIMGAVHKLNADFALALPLDRPPSREEREQVQRRQHIADTQRQHQEWRERMLMLMNAAYRIGWNTLQDRTMDEWNDVEVLTAKWMDALEYWSDTLDYGSMDEQMEIFRDRKEVERLCHRILTDTLMKSNVA